MPLPVPLAPPVMVMNELLLTAVHPHPPPAVTVTVPVKGCAVNELELGEMLNTHADTVTVAVTYRESIGN